MISYKLKRIVEYLISQMGYAIIPNWRLNRYPASQYLKRLFAWLDIRCVLDVGANEGQYRDFLRDEVDYQGLIVSYEPIPELVDTLRKRAKEDPKWLIEDCALGIKAGTAQFHVMAGSEFSSLREPSAEAKARFEKQVATKVEVTVELRTLDDELLRLAEYIGTHSLYLKLDTQGSDLDVLAGAANAINRVDALQTEMAVRPLYLDVPDYKVAIDSLQSLGFEPSAFFPNNIGHFPWLLEFDCYMVAKRHMPGFSRSP